MSNHLRLILVRGLPGAGKSTVGRLLVKSRSVRDFDNYYEADNYFVDELGNYNFDATKLREAHKWCQDQVEKEMICHKETWDHLAIVPNTIIVGNTFTTEWEMEPYLRLADKYGYMVVSLIVENRHGNKSIHNVPEETIQKMKNRFEIKL